jgi:hypothetical protein
MESNENIQNYEEAKYCPGCGHLLSTYIGAVHESSALPMPASSAALPPAAITQQAFPNQPWLSMGDAARMMGYSYFWLAHNWKRLRLHPTDFGNHRMFEAKEIEACMQRNKVTYRGRPTKR